jgi:hypothetical protein
MDPRKAAKSRTNETDIRVSLNLDGTGDIALRPVFRFSITCWRRSHGMGTSIWKSMRRRPEIEAITRSKTWVGCWARASRGAWRSPESSASTCVRAFGRR